MQEIISLIGTVGFPIVMCLLMFNQAEKQNQRYDEQTKQTTEALNELKQAILILTERLSGKDDV